MEPGKNEPETSIVIFLAGEAYKERRNEFPIYMQSFNNIKNIELITPEQDKKNYFNPTISTSNKYNFIGFKCLDKAPGKDFAVFAVEKNNDLKNITNELERCNSLFCNENAKLVFEFCSTFFNTINVPTEKNNIHIYLFSHWHVNDPLTAERSLNDLLNKFKISGKVVELKTFSLSSLRKNLFNLNNISIPSTREEVDSLIRRFTYDHDYKDPQSNILEYRKKFLGTDEHGNEIITNIPEIGKDIDLHGVNFLLIATEHIWPILAIKDILKTGLIKQSFNVLEFEKLLEDKDKGKENCKDTFIPLFISCQYDSILGSIVKTGLNPPPEFIINFEWDNDGNWNVGNFFDVINERLNVWEKDGTLSEGINLKELRDWASGAFRKYCFLDEHVHGNSGDMNLSEAQNSTPEFIYKWLNENNDNGKAFREHIKPTDDQLRKYILNTEPDWVLLIRNLFPISFNKFEKAIKQYDNIKSYPDFEKTISDCENIKSISEIRTVIKNYGKPKCKKIINFLNSVKKYFRVADSYDDSINPNSGAIVSPCGFVTRFLTPSKTIRVLLIDDKAEEEKKNRLTECNFPGFEFTPLITSSNYFSREKLLKSFDTAYKNLGDNKYFDAVLLDLCLDDNKKDPTGYQLISCIRGKMPNVPIIVYSQFDDMWHEKRAFDEGAAWFLKKSEYKKLARHLNSIFSNPEWEEEWEAIKTITDFDEDKNFVFVNHSNTINNNTQLYLIYKSVRTLPGKNIYIRKIGTGYSSSKTLKIWKGKGPVSPVSPVIVKLDSKFNTVMEYERYFRFIRPFLSNECGRIENPAISIDNENSAIVYTFAGRVDGQNEISSLRNLLEVDMESPDKCYDNKYSDVLERILNDMLPRLHNVDISIFPSSSYPNSALGEVKGIKDNDEYDIDRINDNYIYRLPLEYKLKDFSFVSQDNEDDAESYIFRSGWKARNGSQARIELYDDNDNKRIIALSGDLVDHVMRFRNHLVPGSRIWIEHKGKSVLSVNKELLNNLLLDIANINEEQNNSNVSEQNHNFGCLTSSFLHLDINRQFSHLIKDGREVMIRHLKAGNWDFIMELADVLGVGINDKDRSIFEKIKSDIKCGIGVVHGDLNLGNIMVEPKSNNFGGVWLIDFARTRRDFITHDFNVLFTSVLALLFDKTMWNEKSYKGEKNHSELMEERFVEIVQSVVFRENDGAPKLLPLDSRVRMIYYMLRQIRKAALDALKPYGGNPLMTYAYTTALMCFVAARIFLEHEKNKQAAAGMFVASVVCCENILAMIDSNN